MTDNYEELALAFLKKIYSEEDIKEAFEGKDFIKETIVQINGEDIYLRVKVIPTTFEDGKNGVVIIIKNITERKMAEKTLRENEEQFKMFLEKINKTKR
jgi:PAS domain S-box-containing protein